MKKYNDTFKDSERIIYMIHSISVCPGFLQYNSWRSLCILVYFMKPVSDSFENSEFLFYLIFSYKNFVYSILLTTKSHLLVGNLHTFILSMVRYPTNNTSFLLILHPLLLLKTLTHTSFGSCP